MNVGNSSSGASRRGFSRRCARAQMRRAHRAGGQRVRISLWGAG
jgi:hypothetical protein